MIGLSNVDNTSDANKPVSAATQTARHLKANLSSPTFTGTVSGIDKTMVGLSNVDNTSDANKPTASDSIRFKSEFSFANIYRNGFRNKTMVGLGMLP
jgi:hypothetical protein